MTPDQVARRQERDTLSLARTRALADLQHACAAAHRAMLQQAISDLDRKIAEIDDDNPERQMPNPRS